MEFYESNYRNSCYRIEEHNHMLNWLKANHQLMNAGELKEERKALF